MRIKIFTLGFIIVGFSGSFTQAGNYSVLSPQPARPEGHPAPSVLSTCNWTDSTRDVYVNGEVDRAAQVLVCDKPRQYVLISSKLDRAIILDLNDSTVSAAPKELFRFAPDRTSATSEAGAPLQAMGKFVRVDASIYSFAVDGKIVLIRSHPGVTGEMSKERLWETVPVWRSSMESYEPRADAVASIKASDKEAKVTLLFGTWCGDSKNYVPKLLKALKAAGNPRLQVKLIGIDNQFHEPIDVVQPRRLINVPTVIVERDGREIGRIIETPATSTIEEDLAAILSGKPITHKGRWDRGPELARGTYLYRDSSGKERGTEAWELYGTAEGGYLVHSRITTGDLTTEVFQRVNAKRQPTFVEITKQWGDNLTRTRYNIDGHTLTARMRGNQSGIIQQTLEVPERILFSSPAIAAEGLGWVDTSEDRNQKAVVTYLAPNEPDQTVGMIEACGYEAKGEETVRVPVGEFRAKRLTRRANKNRFDLWLHAELGVPVRAQVAGGLEYVLTSLKVTGSNR